MNLMVHSDKKMVGKYFNLIKKSEMDIYIISAGNQIFLVGDTWKVIYYKKIVKKLVAKKK